MNQTFFEELVAQLPQLEADRPINPQARQYAAYYGIDFSDEVQQHLGRIRVDGFDVALQVWRPSAPRGTLFILHGYYDHMGLYRHVIRWALEQRLAVLAFDLPGHGLSSGERASIDSFLRYQQVLDGVIEHAGLWKLPAPTIWARVPAVPFSLTVCCTGRSPSRAGAPSSWRPWYVRGNGAFPSSV